MSHRLRLQALAVTSLVLITVCACGETRKHSPRNATPAAAPTAVTAITPALASSSAAPASTGATSTSAWSSAAIGSSTPTGLPASRAGPGTSDPFAGLDEVLDSRVGSVGAAVWDSDSGRAFVLHPQVHAYTASIIKVAVLSALLRKVGSPLSSRDQQLAEAMIERSDNDATTDLWNQAGGSAALEQLFSQLGMSQTLAAPELLEPWDGVTTTALDQVSLLRAVTMPGTFLTPEQSGYLLSLMTATEGDQRWGVTAGAGPGWEVALKDGWIEIPGHGWTVNTVGIVQHGSRRYDLAVLSTGQPTFAAGVTTVELVSSRVAVSLG